MGPFFILGPFFSGRLTVKVDCRPLWSVSGRLWLQRHKKNDFDQSSNWVTAIMEGSSCLWTKRGVPIWLGFFVSKIRNDLYYLSLIFLLKHENKDRRSENVRFLFSCIIILWLPNNGVHLYLSIFPHRHYLKKAKTWEFVRIDQAHCRYTV